MKRDEPGGGGVPIADIAVIARDRKSKTILAEIGHSGWLKSTIVSAEVRRLPSKISK